MNSYNFTLSEKVVEFFSNLKKSQRDELIEEFRRMASNPSQRADLILRTTGQRDQFVRAFRNWHITYWVDHFAKEIRLTDLKKVIIRPAP